MELYDCNSCHQEKPAEDFHKHARRKNGLQPYCKECNAAAVDLHTAREGRGMARVYVMTCLPTGEQYIGSTTKSLKKRWWGHKTQAKYGTSNLYGCMRTFGDDKYWSIQELECIDLNFCDTAYLREREQAWIDELAPQLNTVNAVREAA